jgi:hypothetical protein
VFPREGTLTLSGGPIIRPAQSPPPAIRMAVTGHCARRALASGPRGGDELPDFPEVDPRSGQSAVRTPLTSGSPADLGVRAPQSGGRW